MCLYLCVFSCSWRFTFYLLAFIAGLAALIDVSTLATPLFFCIIFAKFFSFIFSSCGRGEAYFSALDVNIPVKFCCLISILCPSPETMAV